MLVEGTDTQEMAKLVGTHSQSRNLKPSLQGQLQGQGEVIRFTSWHTTGI